MDMFINTDQHLYNEVMFSQQTNKTLTKLVFIAITKKCLNNY